MSFTVPLILAIVNASRDSFSGNSVADRGTADMVRSMIGDGADAFDVGGQSLRTDREEISESEELDRLLPVLEAVVEAAPGSPVSVDTYRAGVARRAVGSGATMINDPSGMIDPRMLDVLGDVDADVVLTYNIARPKVRLPADQLVSDVVDDCTRVVEAKLELLAERGIDAGRIVFDPGVDLGKNPAQSVAIIQNADVLRDRLGVDRVLWALSRKDFIGAVIRSTPKGRDAGTLGALSYPSFREGDLVRVHDVKGVHDFFAVRRALETGVADDLELPKELRHN